MSPLTEGTFCAARARSLRAVFSHEFHIVKKIFTKNLFQTVDNINYFLGIFILYVQRNQERY